MPKTTIRQDQQQPQIVNGLKTVEVLEFSHHLEIRLTVRRGSEDDRLLSCTEMKRQENGAHHMGLNHYGVEVPKTVPLPPLSECVPAYRPTIGAKVDFKKGSNLGTAMELQVPLYVFRNIYQKALRTSDAAFAVIYCGATYHILKADL